MSRWQEVSLLFDLHHYMSEANPYASNFLDESVCGFKGICGTGDTDVHQLQEEGVGVAVKQTITML